MHNITFSLIYNACTRDRSFSYEYPDRNPPTLAYAIEFRITKGSIAYNLVHQIYGLTKMMCLPEFSENQTTGKLEVLAPCLEIKFSALKTFAPEIP